MTWAIIGTWRMALESISEVSNMLEQGESAANSIEKAIKMVEDYPLFKSVGYGGLPNEYGEVELDAAFMDGDTLSVGAVGGIKNYKNPISIARRLSKERFNIFLVGKGAEEFAEQNGFEKKDMLTDRAKEAWEKRKKQMEQKRLSAYDGHDTVGMVCLDKEGHMVSATSTSGLFMKKRGRVGDSPIIGSGLYADSAIGGASATGLGEEIMKGCLSYEIVRLMEDGVHPQEAAEKTVYKFSQKLIERRGKAGAISVICMNSKGEWGIGTNVEFTFVVANNELKPTVYIANPDGEKTKYEEASQEWLKAYEERLRIHGD